MADGAQGRKDGQRIGRAKKRHKAPQNEPPSAGLTMRKLKDILSHPQRSASGVVQSSQTPAHVAGRATPAPHRQATKSCVGSENAEKASAEDHTPPRMGLGGGVDNHPVVGGAPQARCSQRRPRANGRPCADKVTRRNNFVGPGRPFQHHRPMGGADPRCAGVEAATRRHHPPPRPRRRCPLRPELESQFGPSDPTDPTILAPSPRIPRF